MENRKNYEKQIKKIICTCNSGLIILTFYLFYREICGIILKGSKKIYFFILFATSIWCFLIILAPALEHFKYNVYSFLIYKIFSPICHQMQERSLHIFGEKLAVCERCTAIYFSFLLGVIIYPLGKKFLKNKAPSKLFIIIPSIILVIDYISGAAGSYQNIITVLFSGSLFGFFLSYFIIDGALKSTRTIKEVKE